jgi:hypothetical protein
LAHGFVDTCLHEKGKGKAVEKVSGGLSTPLAGHVAWRITTSAKSVELLHGPINAPIPMEIRTHTRFWIFDLQSFHS